MWNGKADDMSTVVSEQAAKRWAEVKHLPMRAGEMAISAPRAGRSEAETLTPCPTPKPKTRATSPGEERDRGQGRGSVRLHHTPLAAENGHPILTNRGPGIPRSVIYSLANIGGSRGRTSASSLLGLCPRHLFVLSTFLARPLNGSRGGILSPGQNVEFLGSIPFANNPILVSIRASIFPPAPSAHVHIPLLPNRYSPRRSLKSHRGVLFLSFPFGRPRYPAVRPRPPIRWIRPGPSPCLPSSVVGPRPQLLPT